MSVAGDGNKGKKKALVLIDGEHYPPVIKEAIDNLSKKYKILGAYFIGGTEKIGERSLESELGLNVYDKNLRDVIRRLRAEVVIDLSDEPVVDYERRFLLASEVLIEGSSYIGPDFTFSPPELFEVLNKPSISIIGTGKRVGKTAVSGYVSRLLKENGLDPIVITMGRGGPKEPEIINSGTKITPESLLEISKKGGHAASDHWEDALTSGVTTIGCRRCGGGLAGKTFFNNVIRGAEISNSMSGGIVIVEGSGAAIPPIRTDKVILVGSGRKKGISKFFGRYRILLSDLVILTSCEDQGKSREIKEEVLSVKNIPVVETVFRPEPLGNVEGKRCFLIATSKQMVKNIPYLEERYGCEIVGFSPNLSNRTKLKKEIEETLSGVEVVLTELKASAVDLVTREALAKGKEVIYYDNVPIGIPSNKVLTEEILRLVGEARRGWDWREGEEKES